MLDADEKIFETFPIGRPMGDLFDTGLIGLPLGDQCPDYDPGKPDKMFFNT